MNQFVLIAIFITTLNGQQYQFKNEMVTFQATSQTVLTDFDFKGQGNGLSGTLDMTTGSFDFSFNLWTLKTGIRLRDDHMHEVYLETEDYPYATFKGSFVMISDSVTATGNFSIHGVTQNVQIKGSIKNGRLTATWPVKISDYNIEIPTQFSIAKLKETLQMSIDLELKK